MSVKQVFDHSLRAYGKRFIISLKASNRYSDGYLDSLESTVAMAALYAEEQGWPDVQEVSTGYLEEYLPTSKSGPAGSGLNPCRRGRSSAGDGRPPL